MIYLASPYSSPDPGIMSERYTKTMIVAAGLLRERRWCYSPIVHCHEMAVRFSLPKDFDYWSEYNYHMLERADEFYILALPGWQESRGVEAERQWWIDNGLTREQIILGEPWLQL